MTLAQNASGSILVWIVVLIALIIGGGVAVMALRKRLLGDQRSSADVGGLMDQLYAMHKRGELSDAEYARARRSLVEKRLEDMPENPDDPAIPPS